MTNPRTVHAISGSSAAATLATGLALSAETPIVNLPDDLACGPLRDFRDLNSWRAQRLAFLTHTFGEGPGDPLGDPARLATASEIVLWIGTGLSDQLKLAWMPQLLKALNVGTERLRVVQFEVNSRGIEICSTTMLNPRQFATAPRARALTQTERDYLDEVWRAVTSAQPDGLVDLVGRRDSPLAVMHAALRKLLARYPALDSGVNHHEERLLENARDRGPVAARVIGYTLSDLFDEGDCVGDGWLFWRLRRLAGPNLARPAVTLTGTRTEIRGTEVRLTEDGVQILAKQRNFVMLNGIDDWIGGVHLDSNAGPVWFRRDNTLVRGEVGA
jgi:hypothetical protein